MVKDRTVVFKELIDNLLGSACVLELIVSLIYAKIMAAGSKSGPPRRFSHKMEVEDNPGNQHTVYTRDARVEFPRERVSELLDRLDGLSQNGSLLRVRSRRLWLYN